MNAKTLIPLTAALLASGTPLAQAAPVTINGSSLPVTNTVHTWTTPDTYLTLTAWSDVAKSVSANLGNNATYIGIYGGSNNNAVDSNTTDSEQLELTFAANAGLSAFTMNYSTVDGVTNISGFTENPGAVFNPGASASETGFVTYDDVTKTVTLDLNLGNANISTLRFLNPAASAGQTLTIVRPNSGVNRQTAITSITYEDSVNTAVKIAGTEIFLPANSTTSVTTTDGKLTLEAWADQTQTTPATFGVGGGRFAGVTGGNNNNIAGSESVTLEVAGDASVTDISFMYPSATGLVEIKGFASDPSATFDANNSPNEAGLVSYAAGTLSVDFAAGGANARLVHFNNPSAIAGQTLTLQVSGGMNISLNLVAYLDSLPPSAAVIATPLAASLAPITDTQVSLSVGLDPNTSPAPTYHWEYDGGGGFVSVSNDPIYNFTAGTATDGTYRVTVDNGVGSPDTSSTVVTAVDDGDGINNQWEIDYFGDYLLWGANDDVDNGGPDGLDNAAEFAAGTDPTNQDTDGDGLLDGVETNDANYISPSITGTNPLVNADADDDGYSDAYEILTLGTTPFDPALPGGPNPNGFGIAFDSNSGPGSAVTFGGLVFAGAPSVAQKNWNRTVDIANTGNLTFGNEFDIASPVPATIVDSSGSTIGNGTTGVTLEYTSGAGAYAFNSNNDRPYGRLYNSFIYGRAANPSSTVTLGNIPYATYDAYVYIGSDTNGRQGTVFSTSATTTYSFTTACNPAQNDATGVAYVETTDTGTGFPIANYAVFRNQTSATFDVTTTWGALGGNLGIFAVQIVEKTGGPAYADWASANAGNEGANGDFDKDGVPNGVEYFMGQTGSTFTPNPALLAGTITWPKDPGANAGYVIQTSTNMAPEGQPGGWTTETTGVVDNGTSVTFTPNLAGTQLFIRLKVIIP